MTASRGKRFGGVALMASAAIVCPCHLPFVLPVLIGALAGTALGQWLATHTGLIYGVSIGYFVAALLVGFWWLRRNRARAPRSELAR